MTNFIKGFLIGLAALYGYAYYIVAGSQWIEIIADQFYSAIPTLFSLACTFAFITIHQKHTISEAQKSGENKTYWEIYQAQMKIKEAIETADTNAQIIIEEAKKERNNIINNAKLEEAKIFRKIEQMQESTNSQNITNQLMACREKNKRVETENEKLRKEIKNLRKE